MTEMRKREKIGRVTPAFIKHELFLPESSVMTWQQTAKKHLQKALIPTTNICC